MFQVLIRVLVGWTALSALTVLGWSVLVTRYRRAMNRQPTRVHELRVPTRRQAA